MTKEDFISLLKSNNINYIEHSIEAGNIYNGKLEHGNFLTYKQWYSYDDFRENLNIPTKAERIFKAEHAPYGASFLRFESVEKTEEQANKNLEDVLLKEFNKFLFSPNTIPLLHFWYVNSFCYLNDENSLYVSLINIALAIELKQEICLGCKKQFLLEDLHCIEDLYYCDCCDHLPCNVKDILDE